MPAKSDPDGPYGILEISSNTVHFSVFFPDQNITSMIDEKLKCGLGNYPAGTQNLNPEGVEKALDAIDTYKRNFIDHMNFKGFAAIGTGAMRDADDAPKFARALRDQYGIELEVISGEDEGYYAALGVMSAFDGANGIMFDQGGRSTEFAIIKDGRITDCVSLPLGTFTIGEQKDPVKYIKKQLKTLPDAYREDGFENLYVVGGSPRRIMKSHRKREMGLGGSVHGYSVPADEVKKLSKQVVGASRDELLEEFHISKKRVSLVPAAAQLMRQICKKMDIENIVASEHGLRHGVVHEMAVGNDADARMDFAHDRTRYLHAVNE